MFFFLEEMEVKAQGPLFFLVFEIGSFGANNDRVVGSVLCGPFS